MAKSNAFAFLPAIEKAIGKIAVKMAGAANLRETCAIEIFSLMGYDTPENPIPGKEWERVQTVVAIVVSPLTGNTIDHEKKVFGGLARKLGYAKVQSEAAAKLQAKREAEKADNPAKAADKPKGIDKAGVALAAVMAELAAVKYAAKAAFNALDAGDPAAARELLSGINFGAKLETSPVLKAA